MKMLGKWSYLIGLLVAILAALFSYTASWLSLVLLLLAILAGLFFFDADTDSVKKFALLYIGFLAVKGAFGAIPAIGVYFDGIFNAAAMFIAPVLLTVFVVWFFKRYFMSSSKSESM